VSASPHKTLLRSLSGLALGIEVFQILGLVVSVPRFVRRAPKKKGSLGIVWNGLQRRNPRRRPDFIVSFRSTGRDFDSHDPFGTSRSPLWDTVFQPGGNLHGCQTRVKATGHLVDLPTLSSLRGPRDRPLHWLIWCGCQPTRPQWGWWAESAKRPLENLAVWCRSPRTRGRYRVAVSANLAIASSTWPTTRSPTTNPEISVELGSQFER